jgi:hypothetical protein
LLIAVCAGGWEPASIALAAEPTAAMKAALAGEEGLFPFVVSYDTPDNATNLASRLDRPAGGHGFVRAENGRFVNDAGPIRFWATNLCADGCFPSREKAERLAARLARLGINCVRLHHMDNHVIWKQPIVNAEIDPQKLDRLDYLVAQLKRHGVYVNINLHVSRWYDSAEKGFPPQSERPLFDKGVDNFDPRMIALQKQYARDLLTHVNPYTQTAYIDEPAVAFIEINNENAIFEQWRWGKLDTLPEPLAATYRALWNRWLLKKYGSTDKLREAWGRGAVATGDETLRNGRFTEEPLEKAWFLNNGGNADAQWSIVPVDFGSRKALRLTVARPGDQPWFPQVIQGKLAVAKGKPYTVSFRVRSEKPRRISASCAMNHDPYQNVGMYRSMTTGPEWKTVRTTFIATHDEPKARLDFSSFTAGVYELAEVSFRAGGLEGLADDARLEDGSVPILANTNTGVTRPVTRDFCDFLWDAENAYWSGMRDFVKQTLKASSLVTGTQMAYSPANIQAGYDFIDSHRYWAHPDFPQGDWNPVHWNIHNAALVDKEGMLGWGLPRTAFQRVEGKPFTLSEYNHPQPNSYCAEGFVLAAALGAFQGWDAIYSFAYAHNDNYEPNRIESFFDIKSDSAKLVHMPACHAMFVRGDVAKARKTLVFPLPPSEERRLIYQTRDVPALMSDGLQIDPRWPLIHGIAIAVGDEAKSLAKPEGPMLADDVSRTVSDTRQICWEGAASGRSFFAVNAPQTKLFTGFVQNRSVPLGDVRLKIGKTRLDWATVSLTAIDGQGFSKPGRILVAATGVERNRGVRLEAAGQDRITCHDQWGSGPVLCEGIPAKITLPVASDRITVYPLDEAGNRREPIPAASENEKPAEPQGDKPSELSRPATTIEIGPQYKTLWYEIEVR